MLLADPVAPARSLSEAALPRSPLGVMLGSFDPPHHGHLFIAHRLLEAGCGRVLMLVPAWHLEKRVRPGWNATPEERLVLLAAAARDHRDALLPGIAREVLYLRLAASLTARFPGVELRFAMGSESHRRLLESGPVFRRLGLPWGGVEEQGLAELARRTWIFARGGSGEGEPLPAALRELSSTRVRALCASLRREGASSRCFRRRLRPLCAEGVIEEVAARGLYRYPE